MPGLNARGTMNLHTAAEPKDPLGTFTVTSMKRLWLNKYEYMNIYIYGLCQKSLPEKHIFAIGCYLRELTVTMFKVPIKGSCTYFVAISMVNLYSRASYLYSTGSYCPNANDIAAMPSGCRHLVPDQPVSPSQWQSPSVMNCMLATSANLSLSAIASDIARCRVIAEIFPSVDSKLHV